MHHMPYYRAYVIGQDGHFKEAINLDCTDDTTAVESAKQLVNGHNVELWQQSRLVTKLSSAHELELGLRYFSE
jgi:hypothetical protein